MSTRTRSRSQPVQATEYHYPKSSDKIRNELRRLAYSAQIFRATDVETDAVHQFNESFCMDAVMLDVAHNHRMNTCVEYIYTVSNTQLQIPDGLNCVIIPSTHKEAMKLPQAERWTAAMNKEIDSLRINRVYDLVSQHTISAGLKSIGSRCVYKIKPDNTLKVRVVGQGWGQEAGRDCGKIAPPVCRKQSTRITLVVAAALDLEVIQLDVQTAFLNAPP